MTRGLLPSALIRNPFTNGGQVLIRTSALRTVGGFRTDLRFGEDWEFWIRLALRGNFAIIPDIVCHVRERPGSAYNLMATDPATYDPCMHAVFGNPDLLARFGAERLAHYRHRAEAENHWVIGRELLRHGRGTLGRQWLKRSVAAAPTAKRIALLAASYALAALPVTQRGPFHRYAN